MTEAYYITLSLVGFLTGLVSAMGGSGGLIVTPFLIASGIPIHIAIGSAKLSSLGMWTVTLLKFNKADKVEWNFIPLLVFLAVIGGAIGSLLTLNMDREYIYPIVGIVLMIVAPLGLLKKDFGMAKESYSKARNKVGYGLFFGITIFGGFFGAGSGTLAILTLVMFFGLPALSAYATFILPWIVLTIISSAIFAYYGSIDYMLSATLFISMAFGGWVGTHFAIKGSDKLVKIFTCSFAFIVGCKLMFESVMDYL